MRRLYEALEAKGPEVVAIQALFPKSRKTAYQYLTLTPADYAGFVAGDDEEPEVDAQEGDEEDPEEGEFRPKGNPKKGGRQKVSQRAEHAEENDDDLEFGM